MTVEWNPDIYLAFADHRFRPALDLLGRVSLESPATVVDLGCGTGTASMVMRRRWPDARIIGVDGSSEMMARARADAADIQWVEADINHWRPDAPVDLVYSNAALHWLDGHEQLFPKLIAWLAPGGQLAVQMPRNYDAPGLKLVNQTALDGPWAGRLAGVVRRVPTHEPKFYYDVIAPRVERLDIWETDYVQVLNGDNPVADWTRGSWMAPLLAALDEPERSALDAEYRRRVAAAYPKEADGKTLFPFRRLFFVAAV